jgi:probable rRNA maturation factor
LTSAVVEIAIDNRSGAAVEEAELAATCKRVLAAEGVEDGDLGIALVTAEEIRALKAAHLGLDEATDALSFPIDGRDPIPDGVPRQLGDVVLCPQVVGPRWEAPLVHALLHLLGYDHGREMELREAALLA